VFYLFLVALPSVQQSAVREGQEMQSRLLRHFLATYTHLGFTSAADTLNITQPALTKSIRLLEAELGVSLFDRLPNGVIPTKFGEALAKYATTIFLEYDHALAEIDALKGGATGAIRAGAGPIWLTHFLPPAIVAFHTSYPNVKFSLDAAVISTAVPALLKGEIEIYCGSLDFPDHPELIKREMDQIENVVLASRDHPLANVRGVKPAKLLEYPWAMLSHDDVGRRQLAAYFASNDLPAPRAMLQSTSVICILQSVSRGDFLACLARPLLQSSSGERLVDIDGPSVIWRYPAGMATRRLANPSLAISRFVDSAMATYFQIFKSV
jgi:DNA-binding transcriptional LysR family regulator